MDRCTLPQENTAVVRELSIYATCRLYESCVKIMVACSGGDNEANEAQHREMVNEQTLK